MGLRFDRYETIAPIAAGGMAKVYRGRARADGGFERIVAIKVMHSHLAAVPEFVDMFLDEARLAAKIRHPNVISTHDVRRTPQGTFLVMDYIDGYDLALLQRALRTNRRSLPMEIALRIVLDALKGLGAAHNLLDSDGTSLQLVHRDVSPQNILLDRLTGTVHLTDFGVAHAAERLSSTEAGALKGKLGYLSPEHARDGAVDARSDIYSAGVVLWEALTGASMFAGRARSRILADILKGALRSPHAVNPKVPLELSEACMRALALAPEDRYPSCAEFAEGLHQAASSARLQIADHSDIRDFIAQSGIAEVARAASLRLCEDEQTLIEEPKAPVKLAPQKSRPSARWWVALGLAALAAGGVLLLKDAESLLKQVPRLQTQLLIPVAPSLNPGPWPGWELDWLAHARFATPSQGETQPRKKRHKSMYHPSGL